MFPYFDQPVIHIGPVTLRAFGVLAAAAILVGRSVIAARARRSSIHPEVMGRGTFWALAGGLAGGIAWSFAGGGSGISAMGVLAGGFVSATVHWRARGLSALEMLQALDLVGFALPFALAIGRLGCALAHDHRGAFTSSPLAVQFPEGPRFDLGLLEFLFLAGLAGAFLWLSRRKRPDGFFAAVFTLLYGSFRIWLEGLRVQNNGLSSEIGGAVLLLFGLAIFAFLLMHPRASADSQGALIK